MRRRKTNPPRLPRGRGPMRIVAFIERRTQADIIEKILQHCGPWGEPRPRAPPKFTRAVDLGPEYILIDQFLANL